MRPPLFFLLRIDCPTALHHFPLVTTAVVNSSDIYHSKELAEEVDEVILLKSGKIGLRK